MWHVTHRALALSEKRVAVHVKPTNRMDVWDPTREILATQTPLRFQPTSHPSRSDHHRQRQSRCEYNTAQRSHSQWLVARMMPAHQYICLYEEDTDGR